MPADARQTRDRILDAAERLFAQHGYDGVSLRTIAAEADAQLALIHYHFGTKADLYRATWARRYAEPARLRNERLAALDPVRTGALREIVELFLVPMALLDEPDARHFLIMLAREITDPKELERGVLRDMVDPNAESILAALHRALPVLSPAMLAWGYQAMTGVAMLHVMDVDRTTRLSGGSARSGDYASAHPVLRDFIVGGWTELARRAKKAAPPTPAVEAPRVRRARKPARR